MCHPLGIHISVIRFGQMSAPMSYLECKKYKIIMQKLVTCKKSCGHVIHCQVVYPDHNDVESFMLNNAIVIDYNSKIPLRLL